MSKIINHTYTSPVPLLVMDRIMIPDIALVTVAIKTGAGGWKAYQAVIPFNESTPANITDDPVMLQAVANYGRKLSPEVACAMFPDYDPEMYDI